MAASKHHKRQHYVARGYLEAWCDPQTPAGYDPYVWVHPADGGDPTKKAPFKIFREIDLYTDTQIVDGLSVRDLNLEFSLSRVEDNFYRVRDEFLPRQRALPMVPRLKLLAFVAAQKHRTPTARNHERKQWGRVLEVMDDMAAAMARMTPEKRRSFAKSQLRGSGPSLGRAEVNALAERPLQVLLLRQIRTLVPLLDRMHMTILCAPAGKEFITSDDPCVWFDPEAYKRPPMQRVPALMYRSTEITLPLTPRHMLLISHQPAPAYFDLRPVDVDEANRLTRAHAQDYFVTSTGFADPYWYERGTPPPDAYSGGEFDEEDA